MPNSKALTLMQTEDLNNHWNIFLNTLENTLKMSGAWDYLDLKLIADSELQFKIKINNNIDPCDLFKPRHDITMTINKNTLYFRIDRRAGKLDFSKRGKLFENGEVNLNLIRTICEYIGGKYYTITESTKHQVEKRDLNIKYLQQQVDIATKTSGGVLTGTVYSNVVDLRIPNSSLQFYTVLNEDNEDITVNINIKNTSLDKAARIAKILAE
jgi:hypothetical protein